MEFKFLAFGNKYELKSTRSLLHSLVKEIFNILVRQRDDCDVKEFKYFILRRGFRIYEEILFINQLWDICLTKKYGVKSPVI